MNWHKTAYYILWGVFSLLFIGLLVALNDCQKNRYLQQIECVTSKYQEYSRITGKLETYENTRPLTVIFLRYGLALGATGIGLVLVGKSVKKDKNTSSLVRRSIKRND